MPQSVLLFGVMEMATLTLALPITAGSRGAEGAHLRE